MTNVTKVKVNHEGGSHDVHIGSNIIFTHDYRKYGASKYAIITDSKVKTLLGDKLLKTLKSQGLDAMMFSVPEGEKSKSMEQAEILLRKLAKNRYDRQSMIINLGGGVVTDLGGFVASIYMRGIRMMNIPTTLQGMVDAAIGGKTGINL